MSTVNATSKSGLVPASDPTTSSKLALIYSRLAELEIQKQTDAWADIVKTIGPSDLDPEVNANIEDIFRDATQNIRLPMADPEDIEKVLVHAEAIDKLRLLFLAEQQYTKSLQSSMTEKINRWRTIKGQRDGNASEVYRIREEMMKKEVKSKKLEELCRLLQQSAKEKDDQRSFMVEQERIKTQQLETECLQSISAVTKKIEEEEADLNRTSNENEELKVKLEQFMLHMNLKKEKLRNEEKAKELQQRLTEARKAQFDFVKEQEKLRMDANKSRVLHLQETIAHLKNQLHGYQMKFQEFEDTLVRSGEVLQRVDEREITLEQIREKLANENSQWRSKASEADVAIIMTMEQAKQEENDLTQFKIQYDKLEKKCRKLLQRRQELLKLQPPPTLAATSSSSSSSGNSSSTCTDVGFSPMKPEIPEPTAATADAVTSSPPSNGPTYVSYAPSSTNATGGDGDYLRLKTPSPTLDAPTSTGSNNSSDGNRPVSTAAMSTPTRRVHHFVTSSSSSSSGAVLSSSSSPARPLKQEQLVGEGSPVSSPTTSRKNNE